MKRLVLALVLFFLALAAGVRADDPPAKLERQTSFECRWATGPIKIDGAADEAAWKHAAVIDNFYLGWLGEKARPAKTSTQARLLWDREFFYFTAHMQDGDLYADVTEKDGQTWDNDVFELFFKPAEEKPGYYEFQVNAANTQMDMFLPRRGAGGFPRFRKADDFHIESAVKLDGTLNQWTDSDKSWTVEGRIPWRDFVRTGGRPAAGEAWKFALCRYDYTVDFEGPELSSCAPLDQRGHADFHSYEGYATLKFLPADPQAAGAPRGIEKLIPYTTSAVVGSPEPPAPYRVRRAFEKLKLDFPIEVAREPGSNRLWFVHQPAPYGATRLSRMIDAPETSEIETLWDTPHATAYSICFHPRFVENRYVYIGHNGKFGDDAAKKTRVSRFTVGKEAPFALDLKSETVIIEWESDGHNGGAVTFGLDGMMYVTSGDGTSDSDTNLTGQDITKLLAKCLRIDVDHPAEGQQYSVPTDNPFINTPGARPETWAFGFRNPWRITTDAMTGQIWVGNNGQDLWEQVFLVTRGANFGWSVTEGGHPFYPNRQIGPAPIVKPTIDHPHSEARSLTGGVVYYGQQHPELRGAYIYGDHSTGKIWGVKHDSQAIVWHKELCDTPMRITGLGLDSRGELLICDHAGSGQGAFFYLEKNPEAGQTTNFPRRLSETGLFQKVAGHGVQPGLIPYSVNAPLWSDGAHKERWIALPTKEWTDPPIEMTQNRGWNFPDGTVLVKSFALEREQGNPASRMWIETRLMTRQQGEWVGYSYLWNDEQTEATLVEGAGVDREYIIAVPASGQQPASVRKLAWHFPSRTECMVCHSRAANYVLGLSTLQMNKDHDYGGVKENQLQVLERLGLLKVNWNSEIQQQIRDEAKREGLSDKEIDERLKHLTATRDQRSPAKPASLLPRDPSAMPHLVDPYDRLADLDARARSYLHANCSQCHVEAGGGNAAMELEFTTSREKAKIFDVAPLHHKFDLPEARIIAPGSPERSVLLHRVSKRGPGQMPQLATVVVDEPAVEMLREWIATMKRAEN